MIYCAIIESCRLLLLDSLSFFFCHQAIAITVIESTVISYCNELWGINCACTEV
jgi:hypothetical protein